MSTRTGPDRYLELPDARLRWRREGSGPAIVLLHGWALDLEYWDQVAALLARNFTVMRFDRCGFGLSSGTPDIHRNVGDLESLLDAAQMQEALLTGMSQGARLAIHFALAHPARVRGLVLDGAPALDAESELPLGEYARQRDAHGIAAVRATILGHPLMQLATGAATARQQLAAIVARYPGKDLGLAVRRAPAPQLGAIAAPTLILNGTLDSDARRAAGAALKSGIPACRRVELPDAGHLAALDDPQAYAQVVAEFSRTLAP